jgi:hypothetical protein
VPDATDTLVGKATTDVLTNKTLTDPLVNAGSGSETFTPGGVINTDFDQDIGNNTVEQTLKTFSLPANSLSADAKGVRVKAWGTTNGSAITKTLRLYFGADVVVSNDITTTPNNQDWKLEYEVYRTSASVQKSIGRGILGVVNQTTNYSGHSATVTGAIVLKMTSQIGSGSNNEVFAEGWTVEFIP